MAKLNLVVVRMVETVDRWIRPNDGGQWRCGGDGRGHPPMPNADNPKAESFFLKNDKMITKVTKAVALRPAEVESCAIVATMVWKALFSRWAS
jgi:hypothetical protein